MYWNEDSMCRYGYQNPSMPLPNELLELAKNEVISSLQAAAETITDLAITLSARNNLSDHQLLELDCNAKCLQLIAEKTEEMLGTVDL